MILNIVCTLTVLGLALALVLFSEVQDLVGMAVGLAAMLLVVGAISWIVGCGLAEVLRGLAGV